MYVGIKKWARGAKEEKKKKEKAKIYWSMEDSHPYKFDKQWGKKNEQTEKIKVELR